MTCARTITVALGLGAVLVTATLRAADAANPEEDRLRAALKATMAQLQSVQDQLATLQATQTSLADDRKNLSAKYEALKKQAVAEQAQAEKALTVLRGETAGQKAEIAKLTAELDQARRDGGRSVQAHLAAEARVVQLTNAGYAWQHRVSDLESKNLALFLIGNEILTRYEDFSLGNALSAKEPFVGRTRAKLENLVQEYQDKLLDQRAR